MPQRRSGSPDAVDPDRPARLRSALVQTFDLPAELVFDLARLTVVVPLQVTVENHRGLVQFAPERVVVATASGRIAVTGKDLRIDAVRQGEIIITGELAGLTFQAGEA